MTEIEIKRVKSKVIISLLKDGAKVGEDKFDPTSYPARKRVTKEMKLDDSWLLAAVEAADAKIAVDPTATHRCAVPEPTAEDAGGSAGAAAGAASGITIRDLDKPRSTGETFTCSPRDFLEGYLIGVPREQVIEWRGTDDLCCLDVDYHGEAKPEPAWLETLVLGRLAPKPFCWHLSRSGGLHLFYVRHEKAPFTAAELAAVAALRFRSIDAGAGLELKTVVRGPGPSRVTFSGIVDTGATVLGEWFAAEGTSEEARNAYLERKGIVLSAGGTARRDHSYCPICPGPDEPGAKRDPVLFSEGGVFCFLCEGKGLSLGHRRPGRAPWNAILGAPSSGEVGAMVRNIAHWGHARHVFRERFNMPEPLAKLAYSAALKTFHQDRPSTLPLVANFDRKETARFARVGDVWQDVEQAYVFPGGQMSATLGSMPVAQIVTEDAKGNLICRANPPIVEQLATGADLSPWGYFPMETVNGFKMTDRHMADYADKTRVAVPHPELKRHGARCLPQYRRRSERMAEDRAWDVLGTVVPRIDRRLVKLALCAFGATQEVRLGMPPFVFISGLSGTGKTTTVQIAAAILGSSCHETLFNADTDRFRQSISAGVRGSCGVMVNEILKDAATSRPPRTPRQALDPFLNMTGNSTSHELYMGQRKMARVPAVWVTDTLCPPDMREETQIARRFWHVRLEGNKRDWRAAMAAAGLQGQHVYLLRTLAPEMSLACDAILSDVVDQFFDQPRSWDDMAEALGVLPIEASADFDDPKDQLLTLFKLVCAAPDLDEKAAKRLGRGYKRVSRADGEADELGSVYTQFADGHGAAWTKARKLAEKDWTSLLGVAEPVRVDMRDDGVNVFIRFAVGPTRAPAKVNQEITDPESL